MCIITLENRLAITATKDLSYEPATPFLVIYPREMSADVHQNTCTRNFIAPSLITSSKWNQPMSPSTVPYIH